MDITPTEITYLMTLVQYRMTLVDSKEKLLLQAILNKLIDIRAAL